jgi:5-deoxy-glucuronate isomerase
VHRHSITYPLLTRPGEQRISDCPPRRYSQIAFSRRLEGKGSRSPARYMPYLSNFLADNITPAKTIAFRSMRRYYKTAYMKTNEHPPSTARTNPQITGKQTIFPPFPLAAEAQGDLTRVSREAAAWETMNFAVRRLQPGDVFRVDLKDEEAALVLLSGRCSAEWGAGRQSMGGRRNVFDGPPWALYLSPNHGAELVAETTCEIADCRTLSTASLVPKLVRPEDVTSSLRGGGNASRQIFDVIGPQFPADRLMVVEVYTPAGNWSSYPPHKHDVHNPPAEADLDEIYYYRMNSPGAFALQHLYGSEDQSDGTVEAHDGDTVVIRSGYHPVVAGPGYDVYYLNFLAGSSRTLAATEDSRHVWIRSTWKETDPRLPLVRG